MKDEIIESIFGCLERIEEKFFDERSGKAERDKQPVQTEQGKSEENGDIAEAIVPLVDSMNRTNRNLCVLRDVLKIISDRQKKDKDELMESISNRLNTLSAKSNETTAEEIRAIRDELTRHFNKPQNMKVIHDLTTKT